MNSPPPSAAQLHPITPYRLREWPLRATYRHGLGTCFLTSRVSSEPCFGIGVETRKEVVSLPPTKRKRPANRKRAFNAMFHAFRMRAVSLVRRDFVGERSGDDGVTDCVGMNVRP